MGSHYFEQNPESESQERKITSYLRGKEMTFISDHGVFSKREVDFGSRLLINTFDWPEREGDILDVGCGYGPIGITLAKETERTVWLADVNQRALALAKKNTEKHHVKNIKVLESDLFSSIPHKSFAAILTNPPIRAGKKVVHTLFEQAYDYLQHGGVLWVVIQKKQGAPSAKEKLNSLFDELETVTKEKGYYVFCAKKN